MPIANLFENIPAVLPEEWVEKIIEHDSVRLERIVSRGHCSPAGFWYDQPQNEWVLLVKGKAAVTFKDTGETMVLGPGDHLLIPAHVAHRVAWTADQEDTIWLAVHFG